MRERLVTFALALAALAAFYALWLRPSPGLDPDAEIARPTTAERRGNGYAGLVEWLANSGVTVRSWRDRYSKLPDLDLVPRGNLLVLTLPAVDEFRTEEYRELDAWVRKGNTLLILVALVDQPNWAVNHASGAVSELEALTGLEYETAAARRARLDGRTLAQRVREADERAARREAADPDADEDDEEDEDTSAAVDPENIDGFDMEPEDERPEEASDEARTVVLTATGPHPLLEGVTRLELDSDYPAEEWSLRMPYDSFVLTLARTGSGEGALFEQRVGQGSILLSSGGSLFTNRALGQADNARLFANIVRSRVAPHGAVLFDDLRQGLSASYDPARFYRDPRLYTTLGILLGLWLVWVLGSTRLRAPAITTHDPSEAELVRRAGGLVARTVAPHHTALRLFDLFFAGVERAARRPGGARGAGRDELWQWLERHAAIPPQDLDQLKSWYADAHAQRKPPLVPLQNLLDSLERRIHT